MTDDSHIKPRLLSGKAAAAYCGVTATTFSKWVAAGLVPKSVIGRRWDRKAIDLALDKASGIETASSLPENEGYPYSATITSYSKATALMMN